MSIIINDLFKKNGVAILPSQDVLETLNSIDIPVTTTILDPWYNKGMGGIREDYIRWLSLVIAKANKISSHIFVWGFPEIIYKVLDYLPSNLELVAWLTWYYQNCPSVIRGWRSAQLACLHLAKPSAILYPEHFLNDKQKEKQKEGKLRYMPGPPSVIVYPLLIGFVGRKEQIGKPSLTAQKPMKVIEPLILMTTKDGDIVLDPMCGTGTTGEVCKNLGRNAILSDQDEEKVKLTKIRLGINH